RRGRQHDLDAAGDLLFVQRAVLVLVRLLEELLGGGKERLLGHLALLVGAGGLHPRGGHALPPSQALEATPSAPTPCSARAAPGKPPGPPGPVSPGGPPGGPPGPLPASGPLPPGPPGPPPNWGGGISLLMPSARLFSST